MGDRLKGKVAIVAGAGSSGPGWGIGKATAALFAREGAKVLAVDVALAAAEQTREIIDAEGGECSAVQCDVSSAVDVERMVAGCVESYGRVDVLYNNVGITELGGPVEVSEERWDRVNAVNIKSMFLTSKHVLPHMQARGSGSIVNVSSTSAIRWHGFPQIPYATSKAGVIGFSRAVALQYAAAGVRCNCILPGMIDTPLVTKTLSAIFEEPEVRAMKEARDRQCPTGKMGDAWDIAHAALYLASDEAKYVTGAELRVDGGLTCATPTG